MSRFFSQIGDEGLSARTFFGPQPNGHVRFRRDEKEMMRLNFHPGFDINI